MRSDPWVCNGENHFLSREPLPGIELVKIYWIERGVNGGPNLLWSLLKRRMLELFLLFPLVFESRKIRCVGCSLKMIGSR